jgi:hypothetical protein
VHNTEHYSFLSIRGLQSSLAAFASLFGSGVLFYMLVVWVAFGLSGCTGWLAMKGMNGTPHCAPDIMHNANIVASNLQTLQAGQNKTDVINTLGHPEKIQALTLENNYAVEVAYYRTGDVNCRNMPTTEVYTPVVFFENQLAGWGSAYFQNTITPHLKNRESAALGKNPMHF